MRGDPRRIRHTAPFVRVPRTRVWESTSQTGTPLLDAHMEMLWADMAQRINWKGVEAAVVGREEWCGTTGSSDGDQVCAVLCTKGIFIDDRACLYVDGVAVLTRRSGISASMKSNRSRCIRRAASFRRTSCGAGRQECRVETRTGWWRRRSAPRVRGSHLDPQVNPGPVRTTVQVVLVRPKEQRGWI